MARRDTPEINAGSMADIAFLLLIFFLVTTTMDSDWGLARLLPPPPEEIDQQDEIKIKERDVFVVLANANDQLLVEGEVLDVSQLRDKAKEFIANKARLETLPQWEDITVNSAKEKLSAITAEDGQKKWKKRLEAAEILGSYTLTKQVISLQNDRGTSYDLYIRVQDELARAYKELRNELSQDRLGLAYDFLEEKAKTDAEMKAKLTAIKTVYPQRISEAEPKDAQQ